MCKATMTFSFPDFSLKSLHVSGGFKKKNNYVSYNMIMKAKYGAIHGRFQPFHKGHLELIKKALTKCEILFIGLSPDLVSDITKGGPDKHLYVPEKNPFLFFERMMMIKNSLIDEGIDLKRVNIVLFPSYYTDPHGWKKYVPSDAVHYFLVVSEWDNEKIEYVKNIGMKIGILGKLKRTISGTEVRRRIANDENWGELVPRGVVRVIKEIDGINRIKKLAKKYPESY